MMSATPTTHKRSLSSSDVPSLAHGDVAGMRRVDMSMPSSLDQLALRRGDREEEALLQAVMAASAAQSERAKSPMSDRGGNAKRERDDIGDSLSVGETPSFNDIFG